MPLFRSAFPATSAAMVMASTIQVILNAHRNTSRYLTEKMMETMVA